MRSRRRRWRKRLTRKEGKELSEEKEEQFPQ